MTTAVQIEHLVVVELMVHPDHRGRGIGRALLERYVEGHPSAWLCTHPPAGRSPKRLHVEPATALDRLLESTTRLSGWEPR